MCEPLLIWRLRLLHEWFLFPLHLQGNFMLQATVGERLVSAALKGESWSSIWPLSCCNSSWNHTVLLIWGKGFRGCQICPALSSTFATQSNHWIQMWEATDNFRWSMLLLSAAQSPNIHPHFLGLKLNLSRVEDHFPPHEVAKCTI